MANLLFTYITKTCKTEKHANLQPCKIEKLKLLQHSINFQTPTYKREFKFQIPSCNLRGTRKKHRQQHTVSQGNKWQDVVISLSITIFFYWHPNNFIKKRKRKEYQRERKEDIVHPGEKKRKTKTNYKNFKIKTESLPISRKNINK